MATRKEIKIGVLVMVAVFVFASMPVKAAELSVSGGPSQADLGEQITVTLTVANDGSESVYIEEVVIHYDWEADDKAYYISDNPEIIASGDSFTYSMTITIPGSGITTNVQHNIESNVLVADSDGAGGWGSPTTKQYTSSILINEPDTADDTTSDDDGGGEDTPGFTFPIIISAVLIGVGIMSITRRYRKK